MRLSLADAIDWTAAIFVAEGCRPAAAQAVARALVAAEADGLKGHGLSRIPTYLAMLRTGKVDGRAEPRAQQAAPAALLVDAANGYAYPAIDLAVERLPAMARRSGIAAAAIRRSNHCGAAGHHVERLAGEGLVALFFANAPASIAPWGGTIPVFGTNPIAFAAPLAGREPVVVDLSVSRVARGNILSARQKGEPIPEGWALDREGRPTQDAEAALAGTMLPMGDAKGAALAFMVETLAACLVGASLSIDASSLFDGEGPPPGIGQFMIAIDPAAFGGGAFGDRMARLATAVEGQDGARLPGSRRTALRAKAAAEGIAIPEDVRRFAAPARPG